MKRILLALFFSLLAFGARAYDFSLVLASGQTVYFNVVSDGVELTYPNASEYPVNGWTGYTRPVGSLEIPSSVMYQGAVYEVVRIGQLAFYECTGLTSVSVAEGVLWVGNSAFNGCSLLRTVVLPASVDTVGLQSFANCPLLADVWMGGTVPPGTSPYAFYQDVLTNSTLHVPAGSVSAYQAAVPWSGFGSIVADSLRVTLSLAANDPQRGSVAGGGTYTVGSQVSISATPASGYSFICWSDGDMRNPRPLTLAASRSLWAMFFPLVGDTLHPQVVDTVHVVVHDTATQPLATLSVHSSASTLGLGVGSASVPQGTALEVCALPLAGGRFVGWSDGSMDNPRRVTVTESMVLTAFFEQLAIADVEVQTWRATAAGRTLTVTGANESPIMVYDAAGHLLVEVPRGGDEWHCEVPSAGLFIVRVGRFGVAKVTVE